MEALPLLAQFSHLKEGFAVLVANGEFRGWSHMI